MKEDFWLLVAVFAVWAALAVLYAVAPMLHMPGYAAVWGWGAAIFLALALLIRASRRSTGRRENRKLANPWHRQ
jgi:hypothetical protein